MKNSLVSVGFFRHLPELKMKYQIFFSKPHVKLVKSYVLQLEQKCHHHFIK